MTGKELIIYILKNNLENEEVFKDNKFVGFGFLTVEEAAAKMGAGVATVKALIQLNKLNSIKVDEDLYFVFDDEKLKKGD